MTSLFGVTAGVDVLLGILGTTALMVDGKADDRWGKPRERAVLATLAVHVGKVVPVDTLIRWAWPADAPPQKPAETFHTYATRIRRALRRLPAPAELRAGQGGYRLEMDKNLIDRNHFRTLVATGRAHAAANEPEQAIAVIDRALALSRGSPVADLSSPCAEAWRTTVIQTDLLAAHTTLIEQLVAGRQFDDAVARLDDLHADYPDDVTLAGLRLTALYGGRRSTHATMFYLATHRRLRDNGDDHAAEHLRRHHDTLRAEHGTARRPAPTAPPTQLPHDNRSFVGRADLLALLDAATNVANGEPQSGVVLVDGTGGVGKSTLVVHWAHRHRRLFPGGVLLADLYGYANRAKVEPAGVVDDFLVALGQTLDPALTPRGRAQLLSSLLSARKTLVVLDNVRDTDHIRELLLLLSNSVVIVTSRQLLTSLLTVTGAQRVPVRPLSPTESVELLSTRLGTVLDERRRHDLADLCGGLPLFLTVLASDLAVRSAAGLEEYIALIDRRRLIEGLGDHGDGPTSGAACFDPSYRALAAQEQRLFRVLSVHPGPEIGLAAASACAGLPAAETARSLAKLTGAHLIEEADSVNRHRCHDLLAEYAAHCRDRDEPAVDQDAAARRMLDFYLGSAVAACRTVHRTYNPPPPLRGSSDIAVPAFADPGSARAWYERERTNLTAAITYAADQGYHDHAWRLTDPVSTFLDRAGRHVDCLAVRETALRSTRAIGDREAEASTLSGLGQTHLMLGDYPRARRCFESALRLVAETGPPRGQSSILHQLGRIALRQGDRAEALDLFRRGMAINQETGDEEGLCWAHCRIGQTLRANDQHEQALAHLHRAGQLAHRIGEASAEATSLKEIGAIHRELGDLSLATAHCEQALAIAERIPDLAATAEICVVLCEVNRARHLTRKALEYGRRAVEVCEKTHDLASQAQALEVLGGVQYGCGDLADAVLAWRQAAELYDHIGNSMTAALLRNKIESVPVFYQEVVPIARAETDSDGTEAWPVVDEVTRPLGRLPRRP